MEYAKTISRNIGMINKLKFFIPEHILYSLYYTLVLPYINYAILIWGNTCITYLEKIHKLQKWAMRSISNSHYRSHSRALFYKYGMLHVFDTYKLEVAVFIYKFFVKELPKSFDNFFVKRSDIHNYHTRNSNKYNQTRNKKVFTDKSIKTSGPLLWNSLTENLKLANSTNHFRNKYKQHVISSYNSDN